jgi:hypothetical protein
MEWGFLLCQSLRLTALVERRIESLRVGNRIPCCDKKEGRAGLDELIAMTKVMFVTKALRRKQISESTELGPSLQAFFEGLIPGLR